MRKHPYSSTESVGRTPCTARDQVSWRKAWWRLLLLMVAVFPACESFLDPDQSLVVKEEDHYQDWYEYRSAEMGMYSLQQGLADQLVVLGELRGDLLKTTDNASAELIEINEFRISAANSFASPYGFYRLIAACNSLIRKLKSDHPEVVSEDNEITNYDRLYGEAMCMRAWAYFTAVRIYGKIPYVYESLTSIEEIEEYVNSGEIIDDVDYIYGAEGAIIDTIYGDTISLEKRYVNMDAVIDTFTMQLETKVKAVGVNHSQINGDNTWQATIWTEDSKSCLLGEMYLYDQNYLAALGHFNKILYPETYEESPRFKLDNKFRNNNWQDIFSDIDIDEHIYTIWFDRSFEQTHSLQQIFSPFASNLHMIKPTRFAVENWETIWDEMVVDEEENELTDPGIPGDFFRGHRVSYIYFNGPEIMSNATLSDLLHERSQLNTYKVNQVMNNYDTAVFKYSIGKNPLDYDANLSVYRAADIHLYVAEIYSRLNAMGVSNVYLGQAILNDGSYNEDVTQLGVRGRVGFGDGDDGVDVGKTNYYLHNKYTNAIDSIIELTGKSLERRLLLEEEIMDERARELAFEGKRFYDLMRIARRRNDPAYLADKVAAKFMEPRRSEVREYLMNEENWYIRYFE